MAGLPQSVVLNQGADGLEIDAETGKEPQQGRFHHGEPVGYAVFDAHVQRRLHETERDCRSHDSALHGLPDAPGGPDVGRLPQFFSERL